MIERQYDKAMEELKQELEEGLITDKEFRREVKYLNEEWEEANASGL